MTIASVPAICPHCQWDRSAQPWIFHPEDGSCVVPLVDRILAAQPPAPVVEGPDAEDVERVKALSRAVLAKALLDARTVLAACPDPHVVDGPPAFWEWFDQQAAPLLARLREVMG